MLEVLLHRALERAHDQASGDANGASVVSTAHLSSVIALIDRFGDLAPAVIVACARKTEVDRWPLLFAAAGDPGERVKSCLQRQPKADLKTAAAYLLVRQSLEPALANGSRDSPSSLVEHSRQLLELGILQEDWTTCQEILRFLQSIDGGVRAREVLAQCGFKGAA